MRASCQRRYHPRLWQRWFFPLVLTRKRVGDGARMLSGGRFCRRLYRALTIPARAQGIREPISVGDQPQCYGPNGTALAATPTVARGPEAVRSPSAKTTHPEMQRQLDLCGPFSTGVDRSSRGGRSEGAQETGPRQRPQRIRRILDTLKLGLLDGSVDQSTLARLKVASEGLTERSGDAGLDTVPRRNRPACCGRAGEGWGPLDPGHKFRKSESPEVIEQSPESGLP